MDFGETKSQSQQGMVLFVQMLVIHNQDCYTESGSATADALLMIAILLWRLRTKGKIDKGMLRLQRRRLYVQERDKATSAVGSNEQEQLLVGAKMNKEPARDPGGVISSG